jgi:hypothetical protein
MERRLIVGRMKVLIALAVCTAALAEDDSNEFFEKRVRPVLVAKCYGCHSTTKLGGLRSIRRTPMRKRISIRRVGCWPENKNGGW